MLQASYRVWISIKELVYDNSHQIYFVDGQVCRIDVNHLCGALYLSAASIGRFSGDWHNIIGRGSFPRTVVMGRHSSLAALSLGCAKHKDRSVLMLGLLGVAVLIFTASAGHAGLGEFGERTMTLVGAFTIAVAHLRNFKLCRASECGH